VNFLALRGSEMVDYADDESEASITKKESQDMRETFTCSCSGTIRVLAEDRVEHACKHKSAPATGFYDGVQRFLTHIRVQVAPELTGGEVRYNWFVDWS